ncbi:MAG: hypothetical protein AB7Y46_18250 [Armatimonadota bacterium]
MTRLVMLTMSAGTMVALQIAGAQEQQPLQAQWELVVEHAQFGPRDTAEPFVFNGQMWLSNGYYHGGVLYPDLWVSRDKGRNWWCVLEHTPYDPYAEMVVCNGRIYAIKQSVWTSTDGENWEQILAETPFGAVGYGEVLVHQGRIWQLGGSEAWNTTDGVNWTCVARDLPYRGRSGSAIMAFDGKLWLMGGSVGIPNDPPEAGYPTITTYNDVWCSADGVSWERVLEHAPWAERMWVVGEVYRDRMFIIGGYDNRHEANFGDVWWTSDGVTWHELPTPEGYKGRHEVTPYVFDDSLWIVAGNTWPVVNDVWRITIPEE